MKYKRLSACVFTTALLVACGNVEEVDEGGADSPTDLEAEEATDPEDSTEAEYENGNFQGEVRFAFNAQPTTLDVQATSASVTQDMGIHIYEPLVAFNSSYGVEPMLAEDYEVSEDGSEVTFNLREGILFHNDEEMMAEDVKASMERWQELSGQATSFLSGTTYEVEDDYTVTAHIEDPSAIDMSIFADQSQVAGIMPAEIAESAGNEGADEYIGTGPFKLEEWVPDQYIHLSAFEDYQSRSEPADGLAGEKIAHFKDLYFDIVPDASTRVSGLQTGEYDIIHRTPYDNAEMIDDHPNLQNLLYEGNYGAMILNNEEGFFADQIHRDAVNAALNPEEILMGAYGNEEYYSLNHELMAEGSNWYTDAGRDIYETHDPELAEELLEEAGYDGEPVTLLATRDYMDYFDMGVIIQQQLEEVGINVDYQVYDWGTILDMREDPSQFDAFMGGFALSAIPIESIFLSSEVEWPGWTNSEDIDNAIDNIVEADDIEEAYDLSEELQQAFWEYLPLYKPGNKFDIMSHNTNVQGIETPLGKRPMWNVTIEEE